MSAAKDESRSTAKLEHLEEALGAYWDCAYQEGHTGRPDGNKANAILHEIRESVKELIEQEREACAVIAKGANRLPNDGQDFANGWCSAALQIEQAIRMRSNV